ncbi:MAG: hypothetical protein JO189_25785 [Deltaproteobacteria bacterium]|nr:hypothetical protein [Deltaproteobacteria bacterium]
MREYLRKGEQFKFCGFDFESPARCPELNSENACSIVFSFQSSQMIGVIGFSDELARYLLETQLGGGRSMQEFERAAARTTDGDARRSALFTPVEHALLKNSLLMLLNKLRTVYAEAGLGILKPIGEARAEVSLGPLRDNQLIVLRYTVGEIDTSLDLFIVSAAELVDAVHDAPRPSSAGDDSMASAVTTAQLDVKLVLGTWNVTIEELSALKNGDEIVLPDGSDAWLIASSIPVKRVCVKLNDDRITVGPKGGISGARSS